MDSNEARRHEGEALTIETATAREPEESETPSDGSPITGDFITDYVSYADVIEAPPEAHEAVAISLLAAVLNKNVHIQHGELKIPLDVWALLLSSSGFGRNTLVSLAKPVLESARVDIVRNVMWGSRESVFQNFAEQPSGLFVWPELSSVMRMLSDARFGGVKEWVTNCYDNWDIPSSIRYRETGKKTDTKPIEFTQAPRINLLATSSVDWFVSSLGQDDTTGGFIPRWIILRLPDPVRLIPKPQPTDKRFIDPLAAHLGLASEISGVADLSQVEELYAGWYEETNKRFSEQQNRDLAMPFYHRLRGQALKLAVVYEVSRSLELRVSIESMERAIEMANKVEKTIFALLPTGMNREGSEIDKIASRIRAAGPDGLLLGDLTRAFQYMKLKERYDRISTLKQGGTIHSFNRGTSGRPAMVFVHSDFLTEYKVKHPDDNERD